jgi:DNA helicase-2/ATP-dependent DNA helicase PcrA
MPPCGLASLASTLRANTVPLAKLPLSARSHGPAAVAGANALVALIEHLHTEGASLSPAELLDRALAQSGYERWLAQQRDAERRLEHLARLRAVLEQAEGDLGSWLTDVQLGEEATADEEHGVLLATIHRAKGGEWRVVFVAGVEEGLLPHVRALSGRLESSGALEEELRVAYVAVTRPRERLYLTCCAHRQRAGWMERCTPSRFLQGLPLRRAG